MNPLVLLPFAFLGAALIPALMELFKRKDKGPREIPEMSIYEEKPNVEVSPESTSEASAESVPMLERARGEARVKVIGEVMRVTGDVSLPSGTEIVNHLVVQGSLRLGRKCHIRGSVKASGDVEIGESSTIDGHVLSEGKVIVGRNSKVNGIVDSPQDIILEENAVVEAVSTEKTVKLGSGAQVTKRISSGEAIVTFPAQPQAPTVEAYPREAVEPSLEKPVAIQKIPVSEQLRPGESEKTVRVMQSPTVEVHPREVVEPSSEKPAVTEKAPVSELPSPEETEETEEVINHIFESIEEHTKNLDKYRSEPAEKIKTEGLTQIEIEVLKLVVSGRDLHEIGLRCLMDVSEVKGILDSLIQRGCLGPDLKPNRHEAKAEPRANELLQGTVNAEKEKTVLAETEEKRDIMKDWEKQFSSLWKNGENGKLNNPSGSHPTDEVKQPEPVVEQVKVEVPAAPRVEEVKVDEAKKVTPEPVKVESEPVVSKPPVSSSLEGRGVFLLSTLAFISILSAQVSYYLPSLVASLDSILPFDFGVWLVFLVLGLGFVLADGIYIFRYVRRYEKPASHHEPSEAMSPKTTGASSH